MSNCPLLARGGPRESASAPSRLPPPRGAAFGRRRSSAPALPEPLRLLLGKAHHGADAYAELPRDAEDAKALCAHRADRFHLCRIATLEARPAERNTVLSSSRQAWQDALTYHRALKFGEH